MKNLLILLLLPLPLFAQDLDSKIRAKDANGKGLSKNDYTNADKQAVNVTMPAQISANAAGVTSLTNTLTYVWENPNTPFVGNEIETGRTLRDIQIQSVSGQFYSLYYLQKGNATEPTIISFYNINTASAFNINYGNGAVNAIKKYVLTNPNNNDVISIVVDWDRKTTSGVAGKVFMDVARATINKSRYTFSTPPASVSLVLPDYIPVAMGVELPIFKENLRVTSNVTESDTRCDIAGGGITVANSSFLNTWKYNKLVTDAKPANFTVTVTNKTFDGTAINSGTVAIRPVSTTVAGISSSTQKTILWISDSHGVQQNALAEKTLLDRITGNGSFTPVTIGTQSFTNTSTTIKNEARSGWDTQMYVSAGSPFYFSGAFNFSQYMSSNGFASCDIVIIHLGANDPYHGVTTTQYIANLKAMITSMWAYNPNMKIVLSMTMTGAAVDDNANYIKTQALTYNSALKANFSTVTYASANNVAVVVSPSYVTMNRISDYGFVMTSQRDGRPYFYDSQHGNTVLYQRLGDINYSTLMYSLSL